MGVVRGVVRLIQCQEEGGRADYLVEHVGAEGLHEGLARHLFDVRAGRERLFRDWLKGSKILNVRPHPRVPLAPSTRPHELITLLEPVSTMAPTAGSAQMACVASSRSRMMPLQSAFRACRWGMGGVS